MSQAWTTIESDPGVFTELIEKIGVRGVQVEELWSVDKDALEPLKPIYGLIFLFKWRKETDNRPIADDTVGNVFFAHQVIPNACATQAILSILLNSPTLELGPELSTFKEFADQLPPDMKGELISNSEVIRAVHNSFARPDPLLLEEDKDDKEGEAFHFIAYVPKGDALYELDGLKPGPIRLATLQPGADWLDAVAPAIQERMARYATSEIRFNLMAIVGDKRASLTQQLEAKQKQRDAITAHLSGKDSGAREAGLSPEQLADPAALQGLLPHIEAEMTHLQDELQDEHEKRRKWHEENVRRRHNYIPLLFGMLKHLGEHGKLQPLIERARTMKPSNRRNAE
uniref:Ubiquitin carboxyl-terminal hydrolase n=1 Tax=Dunaliella tertiolecta TaxID=3047 RepID=A0A7S3QWC1_DUNTE